MKLNSLMKIIFISSLIPRLAVASSTTNGRVCSVAKKQGLMSCNVHLKTNAKGVPLVSPSPAGYSPQQIRSAYGLSGTANYQPLVAIIDAYDDPTIAQDLAVYSTQFNLPQLPPCKGAAAQSGTPCLQKINQRGTEAFPKPNGSWSMEIALDVEAVHAICQNCSILLVEATSPNIKNLTAALDQAIKNGATVVSNSYGGPEFANELNYDKYFKHTSISIVASSGDSGYGVEYPAASPYVTAVGGTSLFLINSTYKNEDAWSGAGSGCSQFEPKPSWQTDSKCKNRTVADVSAVADPATGLAVYSTTSPKGEKGWFTAGGTSLAAPIVAGVYALAGKIPTNQTAPSLPYIFGSKTNLHDVVGGINGDCPIPYLCTAKTKYDGPTGLGTPKGTTAF